ncbi:MAG: chromosomal replication initiator protein DnaA, partial [Clostridia bacterium]|nr:chromosomal replication initiator protein DnaA [Clostridia bacterium]
SIWTLVMNELSKTFSATSMSIWFNDLRMSSLTDNSCVLLAQAGFKKDILEKRYKADIERCMADVIGYPVKVFFELNSSPSAEPPGEEQTQEEGRRSQENEIRLTDNEGDLPYYSTGGNNMVSKVINQVGKYKTEYTFDNFIVGTSNTFAHAACTAVAQNPAAAYNPLFIYGPSGLGKTHLLYAITNEVSKRYPNYNIIYVKGEEFTNQMVESIGKNLNKQFRDRYRKADLLLIDDIQFIAGREATQEEFFHTFNALFEDRKQIIMTSDLPPKDIKTLEDRLRTRFEWGLIADIQPPDYELRIAIMKKKAEAYGVDFPNDVLAFLAENLTSNVRLLEGAIKKISAYSYMNGQPITVQMASTCTSDMITQSGPVKINADRIISKVSQKYCVSKEDIYSKKRSSNIALARHVCVYLLRKLSDMPYKQIGRLFAKDHSTIMHSFTTIEDEIQHNTQLEIEINELITELKS